ncbi:MAG: serine protease [Planctomycetota bacterium]|nr:MAG: serine protease [Planctomycetota bacterium]
MQPSKFSWFLRLRVHFLLALFLISPLYSQQSREKFFRQAFAPLAQKAAQKVFWLYIDGSQVGYAVVLPGNYAITLSSLVPSKAVVELRKGKIAYRAKPLGRDESNDLVLLKVKASSSLPAFSLVNKSKLQVGQILISVGARGLLTVGVLSAVQRQVRPKKRGGLFSVFGFLGLTHTGAKRSYANVFQHDSPVASHQYGSAVVDSKGRLVGINLLNAYRGTGYGISLSYIRSVFEALKKGKRLSPPTGQPYLGVYVQNTPKGLKIISLVPGGPAAKGGLQKGDYLLAIGGKKVSTIQDLLVRLRQQKPGQMVDITFRRGKQILTIPIKLGSKR